MKKRLAIIALLSIILTPIAVVAQEAGRGAILIGIDKYDQEEGISQLQSASTDARKLGQILSQNGYECHVMVDEEATKDHITEAFIQMEQETSKTGDELDVFLVYFSGRGTRIPDDIQADEIQDGMDECILPSDAAAGNYRSYIRDDALARWIGAVNARNTVLILDCAFRGDETNPDVKGVGDLTESRTLDAIEITDGLPQDIVIISAGLPDTRVTDGIFTGKFLESCVTEEADGDGDRVISLAEAYQFASQQLQDQQPARLVGSKAADIPFAPLPPLSRLQVKSEPSQAEILIYKGSEKLQLDEAMYTPAMIPLTKGTYKVQVQKKGLLIPEAKEADVKEYNSLYAVDAFQLKPIEVVGKVSVVNNAGKSIPLTKDILTLHVNMGGKEIHKEMLPQDGQFQFTDAVGWLTAGSEYELRITGTPVLSAEPVKFTYDGYTHVNTAMKVTLDDIPPVLSPGGVAPQATHLVVGEKVQILVSAEDDGLGLADTIDIQLQPPGKADVVSIPASNILFKLPDKYELFYVIPDRPASSGEWSVAVVTLRDKAGNEARLSGDKVDAKFHVFASRFTSGKYYFDAEDYTRALEHFKQISPPDDEAHYFIALSYSNLDDLDKALTAFEKVGNKARYLGKGRSKDVPQMPRKLVNTLWGKLLDNLDDNRKDASYLELIAITAEELGRTYEAKIYHERARNLR